MSAFALFSPDRDTRLKAARGMENSTSESLLPMLNKALEKESDPEIKAILDQTRAGMMLKNGDPGVRLAAVKVLAQSNQQRTKSLLLPLLEKDSGGQFVEPDGKVREEAESGIKQIDRRVVVGEYAARLFTGLSLGSILLLAALGLAITYGLLGVINMAHGEMIMIGAYATYVTQQLIRSYAPGLLDWYPVLADDLLAAAGKLSATPEDTIDEAPRRTATRRRPLT
jgi:urea transport system permease protein